MHWVVFLFLAFHCRSSGYGLWLETETEGLATDFSLTEECLFPVNIMHELYFLLSGKNLILSKKLATVAISLFLSLT